MPRYRRLAAKRKATYGSQDENKVEEHRQEQNEQVTQQPTEKQVKPREQRLAAKRKVIYGLQDEDEIGEHAQDQNEQVTQRPTENQVRATRACGATSSANQNEHGQQQSMQQQQPQNSQQASREQVGNTKRGPTYLPDVWGRKLNEGRILVTFNKRGQPIGSNKKKLTGFLGTLARNGKFVPLDIEDWRKVPKVKKDEMIKIVKERFEVPQGAEHWILLSIGKKRRHWRSRVKTECFKPTLPVRNQVYNIPIRVNEDQWKNLLPHWTKEDVKEVSEQNKDHRELSVMQQTTGKLSFAEVEEELKELLGRSPTRAEMFAICYTDFDGNPSSIEVGDALTGMKEHKSKLPHGSHDKVGPSDSFAQVRGKDPHGRVRMLGLGVNPSDMWGGIPSHSACYRMVLENQAALVRMEEKMDRAFADFQQRMQPRENLNNISVSNPPTSVGQSSNSTNIGHRLQVGGSVVLKSIFDSSKIVAKGYLRNVDPNQEVGGRRLGSNWYEIEISISVDWDEDLIRPYSNLSTIGDAIGACVAWPRNLVSHVDDEE